MNSYWGKLIGGLLGLLLAGPPGLAIGILFGHIIDKHWQSTQRQTRHNQAKPNQAQAAFFEATFLVMGHIAKADGRVSEAEIHAARMVMSRLNLNEQQKLRAMELFNQGKQPEFNLQQALTRLQQACHNNRILLRLFVETQLQAAMADGQITTTKQQVLQKIYHYLNVAPVNFAFFNDWFNTAQERTREYTHHQQQQGYQQQNQYQYRNPFNRRTANVEDAYKTLGITQSANDAEVKRAYRRLMSQHHPDKLMAKGLPEEMLKLATEKTQQIKLAYDAICAARGMA